MYRNGTVGWKAASALASLIAMIAMGWIAAVSGEVRKHGETLAARGILIESSATSGDESRRALADLRLKTAKIEGKVTANGVALKRLENKIDQLRRVE